MDIRDAFFEEVYQIAKNNKNVVFITADADAFSLEKYKRDFPSRFVNAGVAEQNMVSLATGLALSGKKVFIYCLIPFIAMRCYENIKSNICSMKLPVVIVGAGAGLSFEFDGPTHHAVSDIAVMRTLPEIAIFNPSDAYSAKFSAQASYMAEGPTYVRLDKGFGGEIYKEGEDLSSGLKIIRKLEKTNIISTGFMTHEALKTSGMGVVDLLRINPLNEKKILEIIDSSDQIITMEENCKTGGIGSVLSEIMADNSRNISFNKVALEDRQIFETGTRAWLRIKLKISSKNAKPFDKELSVEDFKKSFGAEELSPSAVKIIEETDFRYRIIEGEEKDELVKHILFKIENDTQIIGAPERTGQWEKGWNENLESFKNSQDLSSITPKFIRPNQAIRLNQQYIMPADHNFENDYFSVFRAWLFEKYLKNYDNIYDFGTGSGYNIVPMAKMFPEKHLYGMDFVPSSPELINRLAKAYGWKMEGILFNMRKPDYSLRIKPGSCVFTSGTLEQVASDFEPFLEYLLKQPFDLCINIEPTVEVYDENNLVDYLAVKFHRKRGYTEGYLPRLRELESRGKIEILKVKRLFFGSLFMEGFTYMVWKKKN
ncbi:MAG: hypothetical protein A2365_00575 [Candidatus Nealsonbacteria bacterium RIFOXYB1_FULL_40_15]|uniref:1-deoxy-D-xylulose-5-phosphate synthase n=2 Tax=Candidatus Nealsoniibacteriota TaxID=1817911 RepID=A0A1G2ESH6_9BACT|nr:MAG: hypothetical protein A2365_00575 [Candidatus Nealsonbacteria bacterium RIFOXYB1_FULL_40_15]OGZ28765.1 MAG: hypothetical protein A2427_01755 [Candidatus Nealsonbacteria bacterium RIFOXYC1_FULL_40_7]